MRASGNECESRSSNGNGVPQGLCGKIRQLRSWDGEHMISVSTGSTIADSMGFDKRPASRFVRATADRNRHSTKDFAVDTAVRISAGPLPVQIIAPPWRFRAQRFFLSRVEQQCPISQWYRSLHSWEQ
jgi:hypothetical protein